MRCKILNYSLFCLIAVILFSCHEPEAVVTKEKEKKDSVIKVPVNNTVELKKFNQLTANPGPIGVFEVPEMLVLCRKDSAATSRMAEAFAKNFTILEKELVYLNIKSQGAAGSIYYNNDTANFIFECVYPIGAMPVKKPKKSNVVVLEASPMLIYNHYGEYSDLHLAYQNIREFLADNHLVQAGPLREFYMTDPVKVSDHSKWLTRIMVPVMRKKAK
ncbi:MAG: GyrI-like domain-containing protein [Bacteroidia bacterium]